MRHIEHLYEMEASRDYFEATERTVTFNFPASDACMLAIAKRFGKSTAAFGGELFVEDVRQLFIALTPDDRRKLAVEAGRQSRIRYEESKGITNTDADGNPVACGQWQSYAR